MHLFASIGEELANLPPDPSMLFYHESSLYEIDVTSGRRTLPRRREACLFSLCEYEQGYPWYEYSTRTHHAVWYVLCNHLPLDQTT